MNTIEPKEKPMVKLLGEDSNIFNLVGIASKAMKRAGFIDEAKEMTEKIFASGSYNEALSIITTYCDIQ